MTGFISICFLILIAVGMPIGFVLGSTGLAAMLRMDMSSILQIVPQR